jgi:non-canonical purine NTP pyrophosphatase (RdgB/HAM1 family)
MKKITFITGNPGKAEQLSKYLDHPAEHQKLDLDEIQSLELKDVLEHKVKQAYELLKTPVLVDDVALYITTLGDFPGPLIKWFEKATGYEKICSLLASETDKSAKAEVGVGYYDGTNLRLFFGDIKGSIALKPKGNGGFGWDVVFVPEGFDQTRAEMDEVDYDFTSPRRIALEKLKEYLDG